MGSRREVRLELCKVQSFQHQLWSSDSDHRTYDDKLHDFVSRLQQERLKIDVFKRDLPLSIQLLTNAVETSRRQLQACKTIEPELAAPSQAKPVLEEFMPLKNSTPAAEDDEKPPTTIMSDKANWMTSVQLWSQANDVVTKHQPTPNNNDPSKLQDSNNNSDTCNQGINNGAFVPFNKDRSSVVGGGEKGVTAEMELLEKCENKNNDNNNNIDGGRIMENGAAEVGLTPTTTTNSTTSHTHRKARRCWSPDLHRRFVNALQMLGGSQVSTPKQIRELMKVEGLTNDEVKSHLQKYRLHTRRPGPTQQTSGPHAGQLVVLGLGGLWVPHEYAAAAAPPALYGQPATSHPASHFYTPQEFYTRTAPPPHLQQQQHGQMMQLYKVPPPQPAQSMPEPKAWKTAERSESLEGEKSGSSGWRIEDGENEDDIIINGRKGSCGRRSEEGEESIRSEISLKF